MNKPKTQTAEPVYNNWTNLSKLFGKLSDQRKRYFCFVLALAVLGAICELLTLSAIIPFLTLIINPEQLAEYAVVRWMLSAIGVPESTNLIFPFATAFAVAAISAGAIRVYLTWHAHRLAFCVGHDISVEMYRRKLNQPYLYHAYKNTSESIAAVNKIDVIVYGTLVEFVQIFTSTIIAIFIVTALVFIDPAIAIFLATGFGAIYLLVTLVVHKRLHRNSTRWAAAQVARTQALQEGLGGIRDILLDRSQGVFIDRYEKVDGDLRNVQAVNGFIGAAPKFVIEAGALTLLAVTACLISYNSEGVSLSIPALGGLALGAQRLLPLLQQIYRSWTVITNQQKSLQDVFEILDLPMPSKKTRSSNSTNISFKNNIRFEDVSFSYPSAPSPVLNSVNLDIPKGSRIGIVGASGSGKSTLIDILMGLTLPTHGFIRIDDLVLSDTKSVGGWQSQIAHVPQSIYLSDGTMTENIAFGVPLNMIDHERVASVCRQANLDKFVNTLPDRYATVVGERGVRLSGGQRQRIAIARALYKNASILIFDEATSALDSDAEAYVMDAIAHLRKELTIVMVAHRVTTLAICDSIVRIDGGHIVAQGSYRDIVSNYERNSPINST